MSNAQRAWKGHSITHQMEREGDKSAEFHGGRLVPALHYLDFGHKEKMEHHTKL